MTSTLPPGWQVHDIAPGVRLRIVRAMPDLSAALNTEIDRLWATAQVRMGGKLFNGRVFSADVIAADRLVGHWTEFRRIVAQMDCPDLFAELGLRPLAVNGIVHGPDGVVFYTLPDIVVNMQTPDAKTSFLKLKLTFELPDHATADTLDAETPRLNDVFQTFLRELRPEDLSGSEGTLMLRAELARRINLVIAPAKVNGVLIEEMLVN